MRAYLKMLAATALASAALIASFQAAVDVTGLLGTRIVPASVLPPVFRSDVGGAERAVKALEITRQKGPLDALILGSSRAQFAFDPKTFPEIRSYNAALRGSRMIEDAAILQHALDRGPAFKRVIWVNDFWEFFGKANSRPDNEISPFAEPRKAATILRLLWSYDMVRRSVNALAAGLSGRLKPVFETDGFYRVENATVYGAIDFPDMPQLRNWIDPSLKRGQAGFRVNLRRSLEAFVSAASAAKARGIDVDLVLPPEHLARLALYRRLGLWPLFDEWKAELADAVGRVEAALGTGRIRAFDFNDAGPLAQTPFAPGAVGNPYFFEVLHAKPNVARKIMARLYGWRDADETFGAPLLANEDSARATLARVDGWIAAHPDQAAKVDSVIAAIP